MIKKNLVARGLNCVREAGSRLEVVSKSLHLFLMRRTASSRPLGAKGNDQVNARQGNQTSEGYLYLNLA